jgi:hypothetical protein
MKPLTLLALLAFAACGASTSTPDAGGPPAVRYALASVVIDTQNNRTTYVQGLASLDGPFTNGHAVEIPGNGSVIATKTSVLVSLVESPVWIKFEVKDGALTETGRISFASYGITTLNYGDTVVDEETVCSVFSDPAVAIVWNPKTMTVKGTIDLSQQTHFLRPGYQTETWTVVSHGGLVYAPTRWGDWTGSRIYPGVGLLILDPAQLKIVALAEDDRCASGGRPAFDAAGNAYVIGDGRNQSLQMFARAAGKPVTPNCLLRIPAGQTDFAADYFFKIPDLTGGVDAMTELTPVKDGDPTTFVLMFDESQLPAGMKADSFDYWNAPAHKAWKLSLGDTPTATVVQNAPFTAIGFTAIPMNGKLYQGGAPGADGLSEVYAIDGATNAATGVVFKMEGYFSGLYPLGS